MGRDRVAEERMPLGGSGPSGSVWGGGTRVGWGGVVKERGCKGLGGGRGGGTGKTWRWSGAVAHYDGLEVARASDVAPPVVTVAASPQGGGR